MGWFYVRKVANALNIADGEGVNSKQGVAAMPQLQITEHKAWDAM